MPLGASRLSFLAKTAAVASSGGRTARTLTANGNVQIDTDRYKWGSSSALFDGTGDYITANLDTTDLGTGAFTWECWFNVDQDAGSGTVALLSNRNGGGVNGNIQVLFRNFDMKIQVNGYGGTSAFNANGVGPVLGVDTWHHVAFCRDDSNNVAVFINGNRESSGTWDASVVADNNDFGIGAHSNGGIPFNSGTNGWIDEVRISDRDRYGALNTTYALPQGPFSNDANTLLLVHADGADGTNSFTDDAATVTRRTANTLTINGNTHVSRTERYFGGSSAKFDGSGDYINCSTSSDFEFGSNDFTLECWINPSSINTSGSPMQPLFNKYKTSNSQRSISFGIYDGFLGYFWATSGSSGNVVQTSQAISTNQWKHIALCREGNTWNTYYDGTRVDTRTISGTLHASTEPMLLGSYFGTASNEYNGYADEFRISNSARYTGSSYTVPNTPFYNDSETLLLLHADGYGSTSNTVFYDDNGDRHPIQPDYFGGTPTTLDTTQKQFGTASLEITQDYDGLSGIISNQLDMIQANTPFTIECWVRRSGSNPDENQLHIWDGHNQNRLYYDESANALKWDTEGVDRITGGSLNTNTWYHIAVVRDNNTDVKLYINGTQSGSTYTNDDRSFVNVTSFGIGQSTGGSSAWFGHIDEFRLSSVERYTSNFTPPTEAFTNDIDTHILYHFDGLHGSTDVRDDNGRDMRRNPIQIDVGNDTQISTSQQQFGTSSAEFDGTNDYLTLNGPNLGAGEWTIEMWARFDSVSGVRVLYDDRESANSSTGTSLLYTNGSTLYWNSQQTNKITASTSLSANTWYHIAVCRDNGNNVRMFIDGTETGTSYSDSNTFTQPDGNGYIGMNHQSPNNHGFDGYIDEVRFSNTARYTAGFTPSTEAFTNDTNTVLLLHMEGTNGSTDFTDDNGV